eukprot:scaffold25189_cov60-Phaeocystis_antarctica.AAC.3
MQGLAVAHRRVIDELPTVAVVVSGILDASADDDRARARTWASGSARRVTRMVPSILAMRPALLCSHAVWWHNLFSLITYRLLWHLLFRAMSILIRHPAAAMRAPSAAAAVLCFSCAQSCSAYAPGSLTAATRPVMRPAASRSAPSQMLFGRPPPAPPAPPAPPPTTPATAIIQRDLLGYASLLALGVVPAVDWVSLIGPEAVNPARLVYFSLIAVGSVYLGVHYITP